MGVVSVALDSPSVSVRVERGSGPRLTHWIAPLCERHFCIPMVTRQVQSNDATILARTARQVARN